MSSTFTAFGISRPYLDIYHAWSKIKSAYEITGSYRDPTAKLEHQGSDDALFDHYVDQAFIALDKRDKASLLSHTSKLTDIIEANRIACLSAIEEHTSAIEGFIRQRKKDIQELTNLLDLCDSRLKALDLDVYSIHEAMNDLDRLEQSIDNETKDNSHILKSRINNHFNQIQMAVNQLLII